MNRAAVFVILVAACQPRDVPRPAQTDLIVVSPGLYPRHVLRYAITKGTKTTIELAIDGQLEAGEVKSASPGLVFTLELAVDDINPDGTMKTMSTIVDLTTRATRDQPGGGHALDEADKLKGATIAAVLSPDGRLTDVHPMSEPGEAASAGERRLSPAIKQLSDTAKSELAQLAQALPQLAMPLPSVEVGVGAKWRSARALGPATALALTTVTTIDVIGIADSVVSYSMSSEVHGADQTAMQDGVAVDTKGITGTATGHGTIDLGRLAFTGRLAAELRMTMTASGETTPMKMAMTLTTSTR